MYLFFLNSFYRVPGARVKRPRMVVNAGENPRGGHRSCNYSEWGNGFLPSDFNAGLRFRPGFLLPPFQLIGLFCGFSRRRYTARPAEPLRFAMEPRRYTFRSNMLQPRMTTPETRA